MNCTCLQGMRIFNYCSFYICETNNIEHQHRPNNENTTRGINMETKHYINSLLFNGIYKPLNIKHNISLNSDTIPGLKTPTTNQIKHYLKQQRITRTEPNQLNVNQNH
jgi:hypothetical protein